MLLYSSAIFRSLRKRRALAAPTLLIYRGQRFTEQYRAKHPDAQFTVQGGGSIASKAADLDIVQVEGSGPMGKRLAFPIAIHEIVIYVNKANPVRELSMGQVRSIFLGQITNWKE